MTQDGGVAGSLQKKLSVMVIFIAMKIVEEATGCKVVAVVR